MQRLHTLVSTKLLSELMGNKLYKLRVLDASWFLPKSNRNGKEEYLKSHIPGASFFDIDECCDKSSEYSHMLPKISDFEDYVGNLGIDNDTQVVVYDSSDNAGFFSSQRVWWTFRVFGHEAVSVLNGGFVKWVSEGNPTTDEIPSYPAQKFVAGYHPELIKSFEEMSENITSKSFQVVDARGIGRFYGTEPEPRPGIHPGHIPEAINIPYKEIIDPETQEVKSLNDLKQMFESANVDLTKPVVAMCGSGVTACCLALAGHLIGKEMPVYDGSWTEWYMRSEPHERLPEVPNV